MTRIYWFSGTGNTLAAAKHIADKLGDTELVPVADAVKGDCKLEGDAIGIAFPVYAWGPPLLVAEFLKKISVPENAYLFALTTYGGFPAGTLKYVEKLLKGRGITLSSGFAIRMPGNFIPMYDIKPQETLDNLFAEEKVMAEQIAEKITRRVTGEIACGNMLQNAFFTSFIYKGFSGQTRKGDEKYFADDKCNGCEICATVCPVGNIVMTEGKPVWQHRCEQCVACLHWCPQQAIQLGPKTATRKRYHHPDVSLKDFTG